MKRNLYEIGLLLVAALTFCWGCAESAAELEEEQGASFTEAPAAVEEAAVPVEEGQVKILEPEFNEVGTQHYGIPFELDPENDSNFIRKVGEGLYLTHVAPHQEVHVPPPAVGRAAFGHAPPAAEDGELGERGELCEGCAAGN